VDRIGIPNPRNSGSVIGADRQRFGPSCVLLKRVLQGQTESGVIVVRIVLAANAGPRVPSGGVTQKRRCTYRPSVIYFIVNKLLSLSLSLSPFLASYRPTFTRCLSFFFFTPPTTTCPLHATRAFRLVPRVYNRDDTLAAGVGRRGARTRCLRAAAAVQRGFFSADHPK